MRKEKELTAYHEAGHALVGHVLPNSDPVHKITIIPRGQTGGVTWFLPPEDRCYTSILEYKDILARAMGGRASEEIIYGKNNVTTGAGADLRMATNIAKEMITEEGMGDELRDQVFHEDEGSMLFDQITHDRPYSDATAEKIDKNIQELLQEAIKRALAVLEANRSSLDKLAKILLEKETLEEDEIKEILVDTVLPEKAKLS